MPHRCKTLTFVFTVFENDFLRIIFAPKMFKLAGSWVKLYSDGRYIVCGRQDLLSHFTIQ